VLLLTAFAAPEPRLALSDEQGDRRLTGASLTLGYRHSVERTMVEEDLVAGPSGVRIVETRFSSFGAGLPSQPEWGGTFHAGATGGLAVRGMNAALPEVRVRVGHVSEQSATLGDHPAVPLADLAQPGSVLTVRVITRPRALWWLVP
jgi:hypothetical protein